MKYKYNGQWYDLTVPAFDSLPVGAIVGWTTNTAPDNYLICDGSAVSRTTYADLFSVIGTTYGSGDGSTTFNLPNLKGKVPVGLDSTQTEFDTLGETGGSKTNLLVPENYKYKNWLTELSDPQVDIHFDSGTNYSIATRYSTNTNTPVNNLQPYIVVNYIIKAHPSAVNTSEVVNEHSTSETSVYSANYVNDLIEDTYSTSEVKTNKVWIDGKPIYRKCFYVSSMPNNTVLEISYNISNFGRLITLYGNTSSGQVLNGVRNDVGLGEVAMEYAIGCFLDSSIQKIKLSTKRDLRSYNCYIILEYTKTTD